VERVSSPSRLRALRPYLLIAGIPSLLAVLAMPRNVALLLVPMWLLLVGTIGVAATAPRQDRPSPWNPEGRLIGQRRPERRAFHDFRGR
jgi:hypothetical protein